MAKKEIAPEIEFKKFFSDLYSSSIQLNFDEYFIINHIDDHFYLLFPSNKYYYIIGEINLDSFPSFKNFISTENCSVKMMNTDVNTLRGLTLKSFIKLETDDQNYSIYTEITTKTEAGSETEKRCFTFTKEPPLQLSVQNIEFKYSMNIEQEILNNKSILQVYLKDDALTYNHTDTIVFDSAIANFENIFKKEATYTLYATELVDGFRYVMFEGKNNKITLKQYFRVI